MKRRSFIRYTSMRTAVIALFPSDLPGSAVFKTTAYRFRDKARAKVNLLRLLNNLTGSTPVSGVVNVGKKNEFTISNSKTGTEVHVTGDNPLSSFFIYITSPAFCPEPMIDLNINPGQKQEWNNYYCFVAE